MNISRLVQWGTAWSISSVASACCRPPSTVAPFIWACEFSPAKSTKAWCRATELPATTLIVLNEALAPIRAVRVESAKVSRPSAFRRRWSTDAPSATMNSITSFV